MIARENIVIRDPFVFPFEDRYLMTGTTRPQGAKPGIYGYVTHDLEHFEDPVCLFDPPEGFWGDRDFWAPEIHAYRQKNYMFCSFRSPLRRRATQVLAADHPLGPYVPLGAPQTPEAWHCLDGTLYMDEDGAPWMVYVREWVQVVDGEMYAQRLSEDLSRLIGDPIRLFSASWTPWSCTNDEAGHHFDTTGGYITDGPFLFRLPSGKLGMLWSSFCQSGYCQGVCYSDSGKIEGAWRQVPSPLYENDSGHGMLFTTHDGRLMLSLHDRNHSRESHAVFLPVQLDEQQLTLR